jgi:HK97 family phage major capsid protein
MTTPAPPVTTGSFQGTLHPAAVARVLNLLTSGAPFAGTALTPYPTSRHEVAFPTAKPDRPAWLGEMDPIPVIGMNDDADIVAVCKLASIVLLSNEGFSDASVNMTAQLGELIRDSASIELDRGILYGTDSPEPRGVVAAAPPAAGLDLAAALTAAVGSIGDAGGVASHLCARPSVLAAQRNVRGLPDGQRLFPEGLGPAFGLTEVGCPELAAADVLVVDRTRAWLVVRNDFEVDTSRDWAFDRDAMALRMRGRFAVAAPDLPKALRKLSVTGPASAEGARRAAKS